jgi:hypothetical protein
LGACGDTAGNSGLVFVSYSRKDAKWPDRVTVMLKPVVEERGLEVWSDQRNIVGEASILTYRNGASATNRSGAGQHTV